MLVWCGGGGHCCGGLVWVRFEFEFGFGGCLGLLLKFGLRIVGEAILGKLYWGCSQRADHGLVWREGWLKDCWVEGGSLWRWQFLLGGSSDLVGGFGNECFC